MAQKHRKRSWTVVIDDGQIRMAKSRSGNFDQNLILARGRQI
ncbi:hypothetical protein HMPREF0277_0855 [Corynebacterium accolens ATCC 49726]|nr:hypothetical protein HMPREF0277_0855 [Corynebacterium accolens ATCC 49726]